VGMPGEIFVEHGRALKSGSPFAQTILAELANDSVGYVPDRKVFILVTGADAVYFYRPPPDDDKAQPKR